MAAGNLQNHTKAPSRIKKPSLYCAGALALLLGACQPQPQTLLSDYHSRLQRLLAVPSIAFEKPALSALPDIRALSLNIPAATINLTDLLALDICDLEPLIAERNSSLGKVQTDASLLQYELKLLVKLGSCLQQPALLNQLEPELQTELWQIYRQKQQQVPNVLANLLSRDQTLRQQLAGSQRGVEPDQGGLAQSLEALKQLSLLRQLILQQDYQAASNIHINQALGALHQTQLIADLQHSLRLSESYFALLDQQLAAVDTAKLCQTDPSVRENLLIQIFVGRVQAELARLDGMASQLVPELLNLYQHHPLSTVVQERLQQPQLGLQQQLRQHVKFWQRWRQCDRPR